MAIVINDDHLEREVEEEAARRGHKANAKTANQLLTERLTQLKSERAANRQREPEAQPAS